MKNLILDGKSIFPLSVHIFHPPSPLPYIPFLPQSLFKNIFVGVFFIFFGIALTTWCCVIACTMFYAIVFNQRVLLFIFPFFINILYLFCLFADFES